MPPKSNPVSRLADRIGLAVILTVLLFTAAPR